MNELNLTTPSLLFSAISLILLAYTNRFLSYASVVRSLNEKYQENPDKDPTTLGQIRNFVLRLRLIRAMQTLGAGSLIFCLASMFFYFIDLKTPAEIIFGIGMIMLACSLALCIWEVQISTEAISLHLQNIRRRQKEQDSFISNTLRRNATRREGESLGEQNMRKNQEKQRKEKQEREERKAKENNNNQQGRGNTTKNVSTDTETVALPSSKNEEKKADRQGTPKKATAPSPKTEQSNSPKQEKNDRREQPKAQTPNRTEQSAPKLEQESIVTPNQLPNKKKDGEKDSKINEDSNQLKPQAPKQETSRRYNSKLAEDLKKERMLYIDGISRPRPKEQDLLKPSNEIIPTQEAPTQEPISVPDAIEPQAPTQAKSREERKIFANRKAKEEQKPEQTENKPLSRYQQRQLALKNQEGNNLK